LHTLHVAHFLRSTHPKPLVLSAQQRNDWPDLRDTLLKNQPRVPN
jgi:hypothetical protein